MATVPPQVARDVDEVRRRTADAHAAMAQAHLTYLSICQQWLTDLEPRDGDPVPALPLTTSATQKTASPVLAPARHAVVEAPAPPVAAPVQIAGDTGPSADGEVDVREAVMQVVADRTGFSTEMLNPEMELQADLGVDSLKRTAIMASLQRSLGDLRVSAQELAACRTLQEVIDKLQGNFA